MVIEVATVMEYVVPEAVVVTAVTAERSVATVANMTAAVAPA
jgi:hypothetical protein